MSKAEEVLGGLGWSWRLWEWHGQDWCIWVGLRLLRCEYKAEIAKDKNRLPMPQSVSRKLLALTTAAGSILFTQIYPAAANAIIGTHLCSNGSEIKVPDS